MCVRDTYTNRISRSSGRKSGKEAEVTYEEALSQGESFLKRGCAFQDNRRTGLVVPRWGAYFPPLQQGIRKILWMQRWFCAKGVRCRMNKGDAADW
jgi:hypothetical protein